MTSRWCRSMKWIIFIARRPWTSRLWSGRRLPIVYFPCNTVQQLKGVLGHFGDALAESLKTHFRIVFMRSACWFESSVQKVWTGLTDRRFRGLTELRGVGDDVLYAMELGRRTPGWREKESVRKRRWFNRKD